MIIRVILSWGGKIVGALLSSLHLHSENYIVHDHTIGQQHYSAKFDPSNFNTVEMHKEQRERESERLHFILYCM